MWPDDVGSRMLWLDVLAQWCLSVVESMGLLGVFLLMVGESMVLPIPSEAVMPPAGWLAYEGRMSFWGAFAAATAGTLVGSLLSYWMGAYGVRPLLERYGRYVLVTPHHLDMAHAFFEKRGAEVAVFLSRFVPVVRHLISIPAGSARMPLPHFVAATLLGGGAWNLILLYAGYKLGEHWQDVTVFIERVKIPMLIAGLLALAVVGAMWWRRRKARPLAESLSEA